MKSWAIRARPRLHHWNFSLPLKQIFPEGEVQVSLITDAYLKVRYGELPETTTEVEAIRRAWNWLANQRTRLRKLTLENKSGRKKP